MSKVFAGMAASLDGYIRSTTGDLAWINDAMAKGEDYGMAETARRTGAYVIGASTYREVAGTSFGPPTYVVTHDPGLAVGENVHAFAGDLRTLFARMAEETDKDICVYGGADLVTQCLDLDLIDEVAVSVIPVLLGDGVPFFGRSGNRRRLELLTCRPFPSGIVLLNYRVVKPPVVEN